MSLLLVQWSTTLCECEMHFAFYFDVFNMIFILFFYNFFNLRNLEDFRVFGGFYGALSTGEILS